MSSFMELALLCLSNQCLSICWKCGVREISVYVDISEPNSGYFLKKMPCKLLIFR